MCSKVRARSAKDGSGIAGWPLSGPGPACFRRDEGDVIFWSLLIVFKHSACLPWQGGKANGARRRFEYIHKPGEPDQPLREGCAEIERISTLSPEGGFIGKARFFQRSRCCGSI